jgi:hypothetical protein
VCVGPNDWPEVVDGAATTAGKGAAVTWRPPVADTDTGRLVRWGVAHHGSDARALRRASQLWRGVGRSAARNPLGSDGWERELVLDQPHLERTTLD